MACRTTCSVRPMLPAITKLSIDNLVIFTPQRQTCQNDWTGSAARGMLG